VYDGRRQQTLKNELLSIFLAICVSTMTLAGALYFTYRETPRVVFMLFLILDVLLLLGSRVLLWERRRSRSWRRTARRRNVIVVGAGPVGQSVVSEFQKHAWADIDIIGYVDDDLQKQDQQFEGVPVLGTLGQVPALKNSHHIQDAVVALPLRAHEQLVEICATLQSLSVRVHVIPDLFALSFPSATLDGFGGIPVIDLGRPGIEGRQRFLKRLFDAVATALALLLIAPLLLAVAILIKLDSPGPVFFRQKRIGESGNRFTMLKFRSMRADADPEVHKAYIQRLIEQNISLDQVNKNGQHSLKMEDDPRITRLGRFIRKTSIDELPQLFNVLRGDMSLVGPRPPLPYEMEMYQEWHKRRLEVPPGITGWWQVKGRNRVSFDEMVRMDIYYIEHNSLWLDLKILFLTPWAVISGKGAG
jgi:exopolysaccharide biosynthesis polyprenyl glycosylphosphotransferase